MAEAGSARGGGGGKGASYIAGIGTEVEDLGEVSVYILCVWLRERRESVCLERVQVGARTVYRLPRLGGNQPSCLPLRRQRLALFVDVWYCH